MAPGLPRLRSFRLPASARLGFGFLGFRLDSGLGFWFDSGFDFGLIWISAFIYYDFGWIRFDLA